MFKTDRMCNTASTSSRAGALFLRLALVPLLILGVASCSESGGSLGPSNGGAISLDEGKVYSMLEQHRYEVLPSLPTQPDTEVEAWSWSNSPFRSGALTECDGMEGFARDMAVNTLADACSVAAKCNFSFDQTQVTAGDNASSSRFIVEVPVLKAPVGLSYQLQGLTAAAETVVTNATFCLVPINEAPFAADDSFTVVRGERFVVTPTSPINLLSNDADDVDTSNRPLSISATPIASPVLANEFSLGTSGGFTYVYNGDLSVQGGNSVVDTFQYQLTDGTFTSVAEVRIVVVNDNEPPVISSAIPNHVATAGIPTEFDFSGSFQDPEGSQLQFTVVQETLPPNSTFEVSVFGVLTGTGSTRDVGNHTVTVNASDGVTTVSSNFLLTVVENQPPVFQPLATQNVEFGSLVNIDVSNSVTDPEGANLVYTMTTEPASDLVINPETGLISGTLPDAGTYTVTVNVSDGSGSQPITSTFEISQGERPNRAPLFSGQITNQGILLGESIVPTSGSFSDLDGDTLTYSISSLPAGLAFDGDTGILSGQPAQLGTYNLVITASDDDGATVNSNGFSITVAEVPNEPPVFSGNIPNQVGTAGNAISPINGQFSDPEGAALEYSASGLPSGLTIDPASGVISGTPVAEGTSTVVISAVDNSGNSTSSNSFTITVSPVPNSAPTFQGSISDQSVTVGTSIQPINGNFSDADNDALQYSASALPANVSINGSTGLITGTPTSVGSTDIVVTATDPSGDSVDSNEFTITVTAIPNNAPTFAGPIPAQTGIVGTAIPSTPISQYFGDIDSGDSLTFTVASGSSLPAGLSLSPAGVITGTPTATGGTSVVIVATDDDSESVSSTPFTYTISAANVAPNIINLEPGGNLTLVLGGSEDIEFSVTDESVSTLVYNVSGNNSNISIVTTDDGEYVVTGAAVGTTVLTFTVTDEEGLSDSATVVVAVEDLPNIAPVIDSRTPTGATLTIDGGDTTSVALVVTDENVATLSYSGSSSDTDVATVTAGTGGNISITAVGPGTATITLTVTDDGNLTDVETFSVVVPVPVNNPPEITGRVPAGDPLTGIQIDDTDPLNITVTDEDPASLVYSASSSDTDIVEVFVGATANGSYQLIGQAAGTATITLTVTDDIGQTDTEVFEVAVPGPPNQPPTVTGSLSDISSVEAVAITPIDVTSVFSDPDSDVLTFSVSTLPDGLVFSTLNNTITGIPTTVETVDVVVTAEDVSGSATAVSAPAFEIEITAAPVINQPPEVAGTLPDVATVEDVAITPIDVTTVFSDPDGDQLTYSVDQLPDGLTFSPTTLLIVGIPTTVETVDVTVTVVDTAGSATAVSAPAFEIEITAAPIINQPPAVAGTLGDEVVTEDVAITPIDVTTVFSDPDGDMLTYSVDQLPTGLALDPLTNEITGTPTTVETVDVIVTAEDTTGSATAVSAPAFEIDVTAAAVANLPPVVAGTFPDVIVTEDLAITPIDVTSVFSDPEGDVLTYSVDQLPAGLTLDPLTNEITGIPTSVETIDVIVTAEDAAGSATAVPAPAFEIDVTAASVANLPPEITGRTPPGDPLTAILINDTDPVTITVTDEDPSTLVYSAVSSDPAIATVVVGAQGGGVYQVMGQAGGTATITLTVADDIGQTDTEEFDVAVPGPVNQPPIVAAVQSDVTLFENQPLTTGIDVAALFSDPEGDVLTYSVDQLPSGLILNPLTDAIEGTPDTVETVEVTISAIDSAGSNMSVDANTFEIDVEAVSSNLPPVFAGPVPDMQFLVDLAITAIDMTAYFSDAEADVLEYTSSILPSGLVLDDITGELSGTPTVTGIVPVSVSAEDTAGSATVVPSNLFDIEVL